MKELSIEEKARLYDEAIEKFGVILNLNTVKESGTIFADDVRKIFPELAESEDEVIRKAIYNCVIWFGFDSCYFKDVSQGECLAWLEKQGEQEPDWSEKDTEMFGSISSTLSMYMHNTDIPSNIREIHKKEYAWFNELYNRVSPQPQQEWSVDDRSKIQRICKYLDEAKKYYADITEVRECIDWLKSLKDRVQPQPKQEWSKEEQQIIEDAACIILDCVNTAETKKEEERLEELADKLQNIRPQNHWKPSEEQLEALESATENCAYSEYQDCLRELIEQLKKLREDKV